MNTSQRREMMLSALIAEAEGKIAIHKANVEIYLQNPAGIGEHSEIMHELKTQLNIIGKANERLEILEKYFDYPGNGSG